MKNTRFTKYPLMRAIVALLLLSGLQFNDKLLAQPAYLIPPNTQDVLVTSNVVPGVINNALINYCPGCGQELLTGIVWDDWSAGYNPSFFLGGAGSAFVINDGYSSVTTPLPHAPSPGQYAMTPDIIIGNTREANIYKVAVVYNLLPAYGGTGQIVLEIYDVLNPGTGSMAVNFNSSYNLTTAFNGKFNPHIDVIAESGTPGPTGAPFCDKFAVTYTEAGAGLKCYYSSFSVPYAATTYTINSFEAWSDVAAIQRRRQPGAPVEDIAMITYQDNMPPGVNLYMESFNLTTGAPSSPILLEAGANSDWPRIDAIDDYTYNATTPDYWQVAASNWVLAGPYAGAPAIKEYNASNIPGGVDMTTMLNSLTTPSMTRANFTPGVAAGPKTNYTVAWHNDGPGWHYDMLAQNIEKATGNIALPIPPAPVAPNGFYWINYDPAFNYSVSPGHFLPLWPDCISTTFNTTQEIFTAWYTMTSAYPGPSNAIYSKTTDYFMAFKSGLAVQNVGKNKCKLYPNPAFDHVEIVSTGLEGNTYRIKDITGKELLSGVIRSADQKIQIDHLAAGMYLFEVSNKSAIVQSDKFIKR